MCQQNGIGHKIAHDDDQQEHDRHNKGYHAGHAAYDRSKLGVEYPFKAPRIRNTVQKPLLQPAAVFLRINPLLQIDMHCLPLRPRIDQIKPFHGKIDVHPSCVGSLGKTNDQECSFPCRLLKDLGHFYGITDLLPQRLRQVPGNGSFIFMLRIAPGIKGRVLQCPIIAVYAQCRIYPVITQKP